MINAISKFYLLAAFTISSSSMAININDQVPSFRAVDSTGAIWESKTFLGQKQILLYFYPAAMTGGCTKQACAYRDDIEKWKILGVEVIGISGDQPASLSIFKKAKGLPFTLLSDPTGKVANLFNVPSGKGGVIERFVNGDKYTMERGVTAKRWTFLISKTGKLLYKNTNVSASKDSETVLQFLKRKKI